MSECEIFTAQRCVTPHKELKMVLTIWIPALVLLGLVTMGLFFAFLAACERV
jgi:hypothetical protein